jgi:putative transposase
MARRARIVLPGVPHHVVMRAATGGVLFGIDSDYGSFRTLLRETAQQFDVAILAACLLREHVHLVATPANAGGLAGFIGESCRRYARAKGIAGLWQGRFQSCPLDPEHANAAIAYVLQNPARLGLKNWPWTLGKAPVSTPAAELVETIRAATKTGRPAGSADFLARIEYDTGRAVRPRKRGRKARW